MRELKKSHRLIGHFRPQRYKIILHPDLEQFTFKGEEVISFNLTKPENKITLHAHEVKIGRVLLRSFGKQIKPRKIKYDLKSESVIFEFAKKIPRGRGELDIYFNGILNDKMRGFYRSKYELNGREEYIATTQFEATDARRAFPCVDEPGAKAIFDVTLIIPKHHRAISNTHEISIREHESGYKIVEFAPTPKMSTYLLAFIVGRFDYIETKTKEGIMVRVFTTPGKKHQAEFALDIAAKTLSYYTRYFGVPYPMPILDLIALPDFASGAMENWGAITYRESALLVDPDHSSIQNKQWVALVIAHEIAHQWFGNLVTMEWWTHLWLNEGFASWIEYLAVDHIFPEWNIWTQFVRQDLSRALQLDALLNTHPIEVPVRHPNEIGEIFDAVSYSKGASVIRMLADYIGEKKFRKGLRHYLKKHQYANASTQDLWAALEEVSGKPIRKIMKFWTEKPGYPVLRILEKEKSFEIRQHRFFSSRVSGKNSKDKTHWPLPISVLREGAKKPEFRLFQKDYLEVKKIKNRWIKFNAGATGVFRTDYPIKMLLQLKAPVEKKELPAPDRFSIQNDAFALAESGELATTVAMELALSYRLENDYATWADIAENLGKIYMLVEGTKLASGYRKFGQEIFSVLTARLGWEKRKKEPYADSLLRNIAISQSGRYGDKEIIKEAKKRFSVHKRGKNYIHPDIRQAIYAIVAKNGGKKEYFQFLELYKNATLHEEKNRLGRNLGLFTNRKLIEKTLNFIISDKVRIQDKPGILASVWISPLGREMAWAFLKKNWKFFLKIYGHGGHLFPRIISPAESFSSKKYATDIKKFFKTHPVSSATRTVEQVYEQIISNDDWIGRDFRHIEKWLQEQKYQED
ncbi:hypothetical protein A3I27_03580 [Candidatus Giovannonibacteria bacterium RIFCSPLOWO2_02_FULL_43_11b]|uniref:Aminopeptidase n=1 Tax=Candidatus Giovannonibacteria bacterium RIFCSPHIGHO2_12_FULL_43_15 TaxID=1798341 RepID=A0A1F5WR60_9BACT|nr:MAG: hypothetical protein A3F23_01575 [Candidatus Giovannonibacteria bacterium RIFCSPHIGHO2_12_FULL_43_15]OGF89335.1 MAG: hypothetical protein A3I27_03580 [Candidatus Giovannonibacteria bacterium RIFCSPLOWO2_02_FULL_43_11b]